MNRSPSGKYEQNFLSKKSGWPRLALRPRPRQPHMVLAREHDEHVPEGTHIAVAPAGQVVLSLGHGSMAALTS